MADAAQVRHVVGAAAHALRARELAGDLAPLAATADPAGPAVGRVPRRYPAAPAGGGRVGELVRELDAAVRARGR